MRHPWLIFLAACLVPLFCCKGRANHAVLKVQASTSPVLSGSGEFSDEGGLSSDGAGHDEEENAGTDSEEDARQAEHE